MKYTLGTASKAVGLSKATLSRAIKKGILSAKKNDDGSYSIDPAELYRVYAALPANGDETGELKQQETYNDTGALHREIELLRERIEDLKTERDRWHSQAERLSLTAELRQQKSWLERLGFRRSS